MKKILSSILLCLMPGLTFAHGEDILAPIFSQFAVFFILLLTLCYWTTSIKKKLLLIVGFTLGVVLSWLLMSQFEYLEFINHIAVLTTINSLIPISTTFIAYKFSKK